MRLGHKAPWCCTELLLFMPMSAVFPHRGLGDAADGRFPQVRQEHFEPVKVIGTRRPGPPDAFWVRTRSVIDVAGASEPIETIQSG